MLGSCIIETVFYVHDLFFHPGKQILSWLYNFGILSIDFWSMFIINNQKQRVGVTRLKKEIHACTTQCFKIYLDKDFEVF